PLAVGGRPHRAAHLHRRPGRRHRRTRPRRRTGPGRTGPAAPAMGRRRRHPARAGRRGGDAGGGTGMAGAREAPLVTALRARPALCPGRSGAHWPDPHHARERTVTPSRTIAGEEPEHLTQAARCQTQVDPLAALRTPDDPPWDVYLTGTVFLDII